ncbi:MAG: hypothetical protein LBN04_07980 [Oscillospiraceae bacterium]|nr:hypothetical protein [Oscillospiraceae bacterium]
MLTAFFTSGAIGRIFCDAEIFGADRQIKQFLPLSVVFPASGWAHGGETMLAQKGWELDKNWITEVGCMAVMIEETKYLYHYYESTAAPFLSYADLSYEEALALIKAQAARDPHNVNPRPEWFIRHRRTMEAKVRAAFLGRHRTKLACDKPVIFSSCKARF